MLPDINVLVAAHRVDHPQHNTAQEWLSSSLDTTSGQSITLAMPVVSGFLRLVTNPKIFQLAQTPAKAIDFIDWLLESAQVRWIDSGKEWPHLRTLVLEQTLSANSIPDAQLAALALHRGEPLVTFDKGFRKLLPRSLLVLLLGK